MLVVGLGGVGAYAAEMIARAGVGRMTVADADTVAPSNINRQLVALHSTVGRAKAEVLAERLRDINPELRLDVVEALHQGLETDALLDADRYDYIVDAIDTLSPKLALIKGRSTEEYRWSARWVPAPRPTPRSWRSGYIKTHHCPRWAACPPGGPRGGGLPAGPPPSSPRAGKGGAR